MSRKIQWVYLKIEYPHIPWFITFSPFRYITMSEYTPFSDKPGLLVLQLFFLSKETRYWLLQALGGTQPIYIYIYIYTILYKNSLQMISDKNLCVNSLKWFHQWMVCISWAPHYHFRHLWVRPQMLLLPYALGRLYKPTIWGWLIMLKSHP
jgi:hypothetical protein